MQFFWCAFPVSDVEIPTFSGWDERDLLGGKPVDSESIPLGLVQFSSFQVSSHQIGSL